MTHIKTVILLAALALLPARSRAASRMETPPSAWAGQPDGGNTEDVRSLSLDECVEMALRHNRTLQMARLDSRRAEFDMKSYRANFFPQVNLFAADIYSVAQGELTLHGGQLPIYRLSPQDGAYHPDVTPASDGSYTLNQYADFPDQAMKWKMRNLVVAGAAILEPLYAGGKVSAAYDMSKLAARIAGTRVRLTESEVIVQTHEAYTMAVEAAQLLGVANAYRTALTELERNVEAALRQGLRTRNDLMRVRVKLNDARLAVLKAENGRKLALLNLSHIVGKTLPEDCTPSPTNMAEISISEAGKDPLDLAQDCVDSRPESAMLADKAEVARLGIRLAQSERRPNVLVGATYTYANGGEFLGSKLVDNAAASVGVVVKMPIDLFGGAANKVRAAKASHKIAQLESEDTRERMSLELAQCRNQYEEALAETDLRRLALDQAEAHARLSKQQYEVGIETLSDHLQAQATLQQSHADLVRAQCSMSLAAIKLKKAAGEL